MPTTWTEAGLAEASFAGFVTFAELPLVDVPATAGVYVVLRSGAATPVFLERSPAGWFKRQDPSVAVERLERKWVSGASVIYIGKAGVEPSGGGGLRRRLGQYRRHGAGEAVGHWGGRFIWQLGDSEQLRVAWKLTPDLDPEDVESSLIADFVEVFGRLPFANLKRGRRLASGQ